MTWFPSKTKPQKATEQELEWRNLEENPMTMKMVVMTWWNVLEKNEKERRHKHWPENFENTLNHLNYCSTPGRVGNQFAEHTIASQRQLGTIQSRIQRITVATHTVGPFMSSKGIIYCTLTIDRCFRSKGFMQYIGAEFQWHTKKANTSWNNTLTDKLT